MARTRSASAHQKVLDATVELVAEHGFDATSMDAIAGRSGVSKATIYKHWADKEALLLDIMAEVHELHKRPKFDTGNTKADLVAVLAYRPPEKSEVRERLMPHLMAYSAKNIAFGTTWRKMVMEPPINELKRLLTAGIERKELSSDLDLDLALALLLGPMMYWYIYLRRTSEEPKALAEGVIDSFWRAFGTNKSTPRTRLKPT
jgi:AcrR family transcriptional regulator